MVSNSTPYLSSGSPDFHSIASPSPRAVSSGSLEGRKCALTITNQSKTATFVGDFCQITDQMKLQNELQEKINKYKEMNNKFYDNLGKTGICASLTRIWNVYKLSSLLSDIESIHSKLTKIAVKIQNLKPLSTPKQPNSNEVATRAFGPAGKIQSAVSTFISSTSKQSSTPNNKQSGNQSKIAPPLRPVDQSTIPKTLNQTSPSQDKASLRKMRAPASGDGRKEEIQHQKNPPLKDGLIIAPPLKKKWTPPGPSSRVPKQICNPQPLPPKTAAPKPVAPKSILKKESPSQEAGPSASNKGVVFKSTRRELTRNASGHEISTRTRTLNQKTEFPERKPKKISIDKMLTQNSTHTILPSRSEAKPIANTPSDSTKDPLTKWADEQNSLS